MKSYKRPLSEAQADACAQAKRPRCSCRCGGVLHGGSHQVYMEKERELLAVFKDDPDAHLDEEVVQHLIRLTAGLPGFEEQVYERRT